VLEPAVTLTDFGLFALNAWFASGVRGPSSLLRRNFVMFFAAIGATALIGALTHGFFPETTFVGIVLWRGTMLMLGVVSSTAFLIAVQLLLPSANLTFFRLFALAAFIVYTAVVIFVKWNFALGLAFYVPAAILMFAGFVRQLTRSKRIGILGGSGLLLTFCAAYIQHAKVSLHPSYFDHNATYHLVQAIGLLLIFLAARNLLIVSRDS
jgi:uncharacterized protein DUF6962